jgi:hypothetical protein
MKKLTVLLPDNCQVDVASLLAVAIDFRFESVEEAPAPAAKPKRRVRRSGVDAGTVLMKHYTPSGEFTQETATKWLVADGYSAASISPALSKLVKAGRIARMVDGRFRFVNQTPPVAAVS